MGRQSRSGEILLEPPLVKAADVVPATEDRSYVIFIGGALVMAVAGGFALAVVLSLSQAGVLWEERGPWLVQAHGWAQLQGWAGLFVAGMGFRLLPRFAGQRPLPRSANVAVCALLFLGVALRTAGQSAGAGDFAAFSVGAGLALWSAGAMAFTAVVAATLWRGRARGAGNPWWVFAWAGAASWLAWAVLSIVAAVRGADNRGYVPNALDDAMTWLVLFGAAGNFIWAVQSRSVPIFFGRKTPSLARVAAPAILLNAGLLLFFAAAWMDHGSERERMLGSGFVPTGVAIAWLAPVAGSCWGRATRLRPRARAAARFVLAANVAAVVCGVLLVWAGARTLMEDEFAAAGARDAARHAFGVGVITLLIIGMAQLVAPFFALRRVESRSVWLLDQGLFWLLAMAAVLRIATGLLQGEMDNEPRMHLSAAAGTMAWAGLVLFAVTVVRAVRSEPRIKATLATSARRPGA